MVNNVEETLAKKGLRLQKKSNISTKHSYRPEMDFTDELKSDGLHWYQELIGSLRWAVELGIVGIFLETAILSKHLDFSREGHI